jgi:hypothetical protein
MRYLELAPPPLLQPYVRLLWSLELETPEDFGPPERIAPDGIVEMVFHYRVPMAVRYAREPFAVQPRSSLVSQPRRFIEIDTVSTRRSSLLAAGRSSSSISRTAGLGSLASTIDGSTLRDCPAY